MRWPPKPKIPGSNPGTSATKVESVPCDALVHGDGVLLGINRYIFCAALRLELN